MRNVQRRLLLVALLSAFACEKQAWAGPFVVGDFITYMQDQWGGVPAPGDVPEPGNAADLLMRHQPLVYASTFGAVDLGILDGSGFYMSFDSSADVHAYLPAVGAPGPLGENHTNPNSTEAGDFGGNVLALQLNVDFSDAGVTLGSSGIPFGDLILHDLQNLAFEGPFLSPLNGMSVRSYLNLVNNALGGGSSSIHISWLNLLAFDLTESFTSGFISGNPSAFAQAHLRLPDPNAPVPAIPEPATVTLVAAGLFGLVGSRTRRLRRQPRAL
jgi:hypothetical protein